ncbi:subtilisin-like protein [Aureobasidium melanogenum CBS 110374]|uniref:Subtilisin-like protein n=1 Tax=Aureobasidium melanogenum (strain CBS 110374) TaxID=1043003 RepID=A0A074VUD7_AURM1|nr:subtilisin-like protein [Aureobasidium melanogenum CBS 110374]KEQ64043.1 subtilisin-like protein [Aureobasidium melanogenum CBS 110374]
MKYIRELLIGIVYISEASVIPSTRRSGDNLAPLYRGESNETRPDTYMVTLFRDKDYHDHFKVIGRDLEADNSTAFRWFKYADSYYAANITKDWIDKIRRDPAVESVEEYEPWELIEPPPASARANSDIVKRDLQPWFPDVYEQSPWHLQALTASGKLDNMPDQGPATQIKYNNTVGGGQGVNIYIVDSGVDIDHVLFQGRARNFHQCYVEADGDCFKDFHGHGTAVAGCAAGRFFGSAQGANIINVKAFFTFSKRPPQTLPGDLEKALEGILDEHLANVANPPPGFRGSVVNLSLGKDKGRGDAVRNTLDRFYMAGVPVVTAAGNAREAGVSADNIWPCKFNSICVGAISRKYEQDKYSNMGKNVSVLAPGTDIRTLAPGGGAIFKTGTSFAAPLVAGVLATFMGWENLGHEGLDNPNLIRSRLDANLLRGILTDWKNGADLGGSENNMVTSGINYPGKPAEDPYNGVGEGVDNTYQTDYNPFEVVTATGDFTLNPQPTEDPQPTPIAEPTITQSFSDIPAAATTEAEVDDNNFDSTGDGSDIDTSEPTATASPTSDDRPKIITPVGDGHGCLYVGCPDDYICNTVGNCVLD